MAAVVASQDVESVDPGAAGPTLCTSPPTQELRDKGRDMASSSKKKTTMAKLNRERAVHERRLQKQEKKDARKRAAAAAVSKTPTRDAGADADPPDARRRGM